jgi:Replication-relaxation
VTRQSVAVGVALALSSIRSLPSPERYARADSPRNLFPSSYNEESSPGYMSTARLDWLRERMSAREWAVMGDVARLRLVTGAQLERLHFDRLEGASRAVVRRRVLGRLVQLRVLATLERRIGGVRAGSAGLVYGLDVSGKRLVAAGARPRRPSVPSVRFVRHVLAVAELYVSLVEQARDGGLRLDSFKAEPACWWPDGRGGVLKPDGYAAVASPEHVDHWWLEVDLATEHLPTLKRKLVAYLEFWSDGQLGPDDVMPRVLVAVPDAKRYSELVRLIHQLPPEAENLFVVAVAKDATDNVMRCLNSPN